MILDNRSLDDIMIEFVKNILAAIRDITLASKLELFFHMRISRRIYLANIISNAY